MQHKQSPTSRVLLKLTEVGGAFPAHLPLAINAADAYMIIYDVGDRSSFDACWGLFRNIVDTRCIQPNLLSIMLIGFIIIPYLIKGSKIDLVANGVAKRQVSGEMGKDLAKVMGALVN